MQSVELSIVMTSLLFNLVRLGLEPLATILHTDIPKINNVFSFNVCQRLITTYLDIRGVFRQSHYGTLHLEDFTYAHFLRAI